MPFMRSLLKTVIDKKEKIDEVIVRASSGQNVHAHFRVQPKYPSCWSGAPPIRGSRASAASRRRWRHNSACKMVRRQFLGRDHEQSYVCGLRGIFNRSYETPHEQLARERLPPIGRERLRKGIPPGWGEHLRKMLVRRWFSSDEQ